MLMKKYFRRIGVSLMAGCLMLSTCVTPAMATEYETAEQTTETTEETSTEVATGTTETTETQETGEVDNTDSIQSDKICESNETETPEITSTEMAEVPQTDIPEETGISVLSDDSGELISVLSDENDQIGDLKLVYGDEELADEDALVLFMTGDGFTADEQDKFYEEAEKTAAYIMSCSPYDEFTDTFKIYALGVVSNESGSKADQASTWEDAQNDTRDTYFGSSFWGSGVQRIVVLSDEGLEKGEALQEKYCPDADFSVYLVNSSTYGGSGGDYCVASLNSESLEMMLHELGHTIGKLQDEYYVANYAVEAANLTQQSDPEQVKWSRFVGKNGIGVYNWGGQDCGWYTPSQKCKMQYLGTEYAFCEVCKEALRTAFCNNSNVTKISFQTYADEFYENQSPDMKEYFILRKGTNETNGDKLGNALQLTYYDADGKVVDGIPQTAGDYTIKAVFAGNGTYDACEITASYTISLPDIITASISDKVQDGSPAELTYTVDYEGTYSIGIKYSGSQGYTASLGLSNYLWEYYSSSLYSTDPDTSDDQYSVTHYIYDWYNYDYVEYESYATPDGPSDPGYYTVTITVYDETGKTIGTKSLDYQIKFKTETLINNDDANYGGANEIGNNKIIVIWGEGYTAEEQDKFIEDAKTLAEGMLEEEPLKELKQYFNFVAINSISETSGIGTTAKDTFFRLTYDENGKIQASYNATDMASYMAWEHVSNNYRDCIVIVNDENATEGSVFGYDPTDTWKRFHTIFVPAGEAGIEYAATELTNHMNNVEAGYRCETEEDSEAQRLGAISYLTTTYCPVVVSRAYDETFIEDGTAYDLTDYFEVYYGTQKITDLDLELTYYADDNGQPGEELDGAPSEAGTYHVKAVTVHYPGYDDWTWSDEAYSWLYVARGWTTYTILAQDDEEQPDDDPIDDNQNNNDQINNDQNNNDQINDDQNNSDKINDDQLNNVSNENQTETIDADSSSTETTTTAQEQTTKTTATPVTSDVSSTGLWTMVGLMAGVVMVSLVVRRKRFNH